MNGADTLLTAQQPTQALARGFALTEQPSPTARCDFAHHLHPHTNLARHEETSPLVLTHGKGFYVYDEQRP